MGAPFNRILWSVQAGVVLTTAGAGLWLAKNGIIDEAAQAMQVVAILTMALGLGFVAVGARLLRAVAAARPGQLAGQPCVT